MTVVKYDVSGVEPGQDFDIPFPAGIYQMELEEVEFTKSNTSGDDMLKITLKVIKGDHKGRKVWEYIVLSGSQDFRLRNLVDALGTKNGAADIDYNKDTKLVKTIGKVKVGGKKLNVNVKIEGSKDDDFGEQNKVKSFLVPKDGDEAEEPEEEEAEEAEEPEDEAGGDDEWTYDDLAKMDRAELKAWKKEQEAETKVTKGKSDDELRKELAEEFSLSGIPGEEEEEEEGEEEEEAEETEEVDYDSMSLAELKSAAEENGINPKGTKAALAKKLKKAAKEAGTKSDESDPF